MATTFDLFVLGTAPQIDTIEGNLTSENHGALEGLVFGSTANPLAGTVATLSPDIDLLLFPDYTGGATSNAYDSNNFLSNEEFVIGGVRYTHDATMIYNNTVITYTDGTTATVNAIVMQATNGTLYLIPPPSGPTAYSDALEAKPILSVTLGTAAPSNGTDVYAMTADRYDLTFSDYVVEGTTGNDLIDAAYLGDPEGDRIDDTDNLAGTNADLVTAGLGNDTVRAGAGNDTVFGSDGNDLLDGGTGNDSLDGGNGNDTLIGGAGADTFIGGTGLDLLSYATSGAAVNVNLQTNTLTGGDATGDVIISGVDGIIGSAFDDTLVGYDDIFDGGTTTNVIDGGAGNDSIDGRDGADSLLGGSGDDTILGGGGNDTIYYGSGNDSVEGGAGNDFIDDALGFDSTADASTVSGGDGNDTIFGSSAGDILSGDAGNDSIGGESGNDLIDGGAGSDTIQGGAGNDTILTSGGNDSLQGGDGADVIRATATDPSGVYSFNVDGGFGGVDNDTLDLSALIADGWTISSMTQNSENNGSPGFSGQIFLSRGAQSATINYTDIENILLSDFIVEGTAGGDLIDLNYTGDPNGDRVDNTDAADGSNDDEIVAGAGDDTILAGSGNDTVLGEDGADLILGAAGDDSLLGGANNDTIAGGTGADTLDGGTGSNTLDYSGSAGSVTVNLETNTAFGSDADGDVISNFQNVIGSNFGDTITLSNTSGTILAGSGNDGLAGGSGDDTIFGQDGADTILAGAGNDVIVAGAGDDEIVLDDTLQNDTIFGGDTDEVLGDLINLSSISDGLLVYYFGEGVGSIADDVSMTEFSGIERLLLGTGDDTVVGSDGVEQIIGNSGNDLIFAGGGNDTIFSGFDNDFVDGGAGDDSILAASGADTIVGGAGNDQIDLGPDDGDRDLLVLADGSGNDVVSSFAAPTDNGDGTYTSGDLLDVTGLTSDGTTPVTTADVTVTDTNGDGTGDAILTFPGGESLTLVGVPMSSVDNTPALVAMGIPDGRDFIVEGTDAGDLITVDYTGDPDGDRVDANDAADGSQDDEIIAGAGNDTIDAGAGNDVIVAGAGDDEIVLDDTLQNDTIFGGDTDEVLGDLINLSSISDGLLVYYFGEGVGSIADDVSMTEFSGIERLLLGTGDDTVVGSDGVEQIIGNSGNDLIFAGGGNDTIFSGFDNDFVDGGAGDDSILAASGADTIVGGAGNDQIDLGPDDGDRDLLVLADGSGNDVVSSFAAPTDNGDGTYTSGDLLDVTGLTSDGTTPVTTADVTVTDTNGDGTGDAILTFPGGESLTLVGVPMSSVDNTPALVAMGIPDGRDFIVEGTDAGDLITVDYTGDPDGDRVDANDAADGSQDDEIIAGAGNDTIDAGAGNDVIVAGAGDDEIVLDDTLQNDTIFGGDTDEVLGDLINLSSISDGLLVYYFGEGVGSIADDVSMTEFSGIERLLMGTGDDTVVGSDGVEQIIGNSGNDLIFAGGGNDTIFSGFDNDFVDGGAGDDSILAASGADTIVGGAGNDQIDLGPDDGDRDLLVLADGSGNDVVSGFETPTDNGDGTYTSGDLLDVTGLTSDGTTPVTTADVTVTDTNGDGTGDAILTFPGGESLTLVGVPMSSVDNTPALVAMGIPDGRNFIVEGTDAGDLITVDYTGDPGGDRVDANDAADGSQDDQIIAGAGNDTIDAGAGNDTVYGGIGDDSIAGGSGNDTLLGEDGNDTINGGFGQDVVYGGAGDDVLSVAITGVGDPQHLNDTLYGEDGNDQLFGSNNSQYLDGGDGNDTISGDSGINGGWESASGSSETDTLIGGAGNDLIYSGFTGSATLETGDSLVGGDGNDTLIGGTANDTIEGGNDSDSILAGAGNDRIFGDAGNDSLDGGADADTLFGGTGNDTINVSQGDSAEGGDGDDFFRLTDLGEAATDTITLIGGEGDETLGDTLWLGEFASKADISFTNTDDAAGGLAGTFTMTDGTVVNFSEIENIICFTPGARILTQWGERPVESLRLGDMVVTRDHGLQPIRWVGKRTVAGLGDFAPISIASSVMGGQEPLLVSPQHRLLFTGYQAELLFGESEVLVAAKHMVNGRDVTVSPRDAVTYIHIMFDRHEIIYADGIGTESFYAGDMALGAIDAAAREELFTIFPELRSAPGHHRDTARSCLRRHEAQLLCSLGEKDVA
ncbi:Type I secretion target repeat protein (modular protein) [Roseovarius sp. EC-HK134]|uniref:Hint domain-containing protein n=1 Tax=unclassified Roseovarius TaxID=2614913 RepID=UPI001251E8E2|nr:MULTISPECIES: Hint domain-containing protein [unclassified Roseovarius]VVS97803.1 Type I secretion target repeat protein (modular protein) [Roseovarius sp. EC-HK134]VVS99049.1 Type I secretion target repeat protein (modular protein) [Roseovarius sp. EC-SD190]